MRVESRASLRGFTLLEVLVALLLMALALTALVRLSGLEARATAQLRDTTLAQWVAANALAEVRLREPLPAIGLRQGEASMGGRRWRWRMNIAATDEATIRRLDVDVLAPDQRQGSEDGVVATLTGFSVQ
jgi:general secretion pathway protein I